MRPLGVLATLLAGTARAAPPPLCALPAAVAGRLPDCRRSFAPPIGRNIGSHLSSIHFSALLGWRLITRAPDVCWPEGSRIRWSQAPAYSKMEIVPSSIKEVSLKTHNHRAPIIECRAISISSARETREEAANIHRFNANSQFNSSSEIAFYVKYAGAVRLTIQNCVRFGPSTHCQAVEFQ